MFSHTTRADCKDSPIKTACIGKSHQKSINITAYREEYDRNVERVKSRRGRYMKGKRQSTVEPVIGTLDLKLNFIFFKIKIEIDSKTKICGICRN
ncbi:transposase [Autumnicola psychrophila]|uniref:Transposase n=1 Tax=Autumnicola psychrophila TaxID=3075592 RepID=A0ABU3DNE6_9FLAO|nr:transposase [Zunongwangia sp. F225]MDT0685231.1 transposase [Zunongwangia sp. F225]